MGEIEVPQGHFCPPGPKEEDGDHIVPYGLDHKKGGLPKDWKGAPEMSSKLTELNEYSPSVPLPSVLCGSGIFSLLPSPQSMASSGNSDPSQAYDGYKEVEFLDPACNKFLKKEKQCFQPYNPWYFNFHHCFVGKKHCQCPGASIFNVRWYLWSKKDVPFGREFPVSEAPNPDANWGHSNLTGSRQRDVERWTNVGGPIPIDSRPIHPSLEVPISRINSQDVVKRIRRISDLPTDPNAEGSDELDEEEEVEVVPNSIGHKSSDSPSQPASRIFQSQVIPSTPRNLQPVLPWFHQ
ncbi:hypothetical protein O181_019006 [Austropuccinia psidii MF-1]|uniref:Uncharacterized protein n=1 Tax=Austropuccinia psidii MF-1 TaxID=1389203 RepID=A0A9Q3GTF9_9BASI|nr:hypothetical protein [Austropuccinia psidii MF-1]